MRDRDIAGAIVAGNPAGLEAAYDTYAVGLHAYCRTLLGEPADAADAVQDTFVIAAAKLRGLRDWERLRPWLYAVARNECHRRLRGRARRATLDEAGEMSDAGADVAIQAERKELQGLVRAAIGGLNPGDREVIELHLRHELEGPDLADTLGVPANQAHALASRARAQLERSLGALLVARTGRGDCAALDALLGGWDGRLTVLLRKRVSRHIEDCEICGARKRQELSPAMLLSVLPLAMLPDSLREQVLRLVSDTSPAAVRARDEVARRAEPFAHSGFPVQIAPPGGAGSAGDGSGPAGPAGLAGLWQAAARRSVAGVVAVAAVLVILIGGAILAAYLHMNGTGHRNAAAHGTATVGPVGTTAAPSASGAGQVPGGSSPSSSAGTTTKPSASASRTKPASSSTPRSSPSADSSPTSSSSASPTPGTLTESPATVQLPQVSGGSISAGTFTLTAAGGPVTYAISGAPSYLSVSPASGTLAAGQQATITVTLTLDPAGAATPGSTSLTISPGGLTVTVASPVASTAARGR